MGMFTQALNGVQTKLGSVSKGMVSAYQRNSLANRKQFGAASIMAGSLSGGFSGLGKRAGMSYNALGRGEKTAMLGQIGGLAGGATIGFGASPDGWGGTGAGVGAAAGLFGGARAAGIGAAFVRSKGGISGMKQGAKHTMTGAYAGMLDAARNPGRTASNVWNRTQGGAASAYGSTSATVKQAGESVMGAASRFKQGFMANRAARQAGG